MVFLLPGTRCADRVTVMRSTVIAPSYTALAHATVRRTTSGCASSVTMTGEPGAMQSLGNAGAEVAGAFQEDEDGGKENHLIKRRNVFRGTQRPNYVPE